MAPVPYRIRANSMDAVAAAAAVGLGFGLAALLARR